MRAPVVARMVFIGLSASLTVSAATPPPGPEKGKLAIYINNRAPKVFGSEEIGRLPHSDVVVEGQGGRSRKFSGVPLADLLEAAGMDLGGEQRPAALTTYLWVEASDGYRVLLSGTEVNKFIGAGDVLLADAENGQAIPKTEGPYRLLVTSDKVHARWLRQVRAVYVVQAGPPPNSTR